MQVWHVTCEQFLLPSISPTCSPCPSWICIHPSLAITPGSYPHWARYPRLRRLYWGLLNLLNAALQCFSARLGTAPALCWHSSNPLWGGDGILVCCARALWVRENKRAWIKSDEGKRKYNGSTTSWLDPLEEDIRWWNRVFYFTLWAGDSRTGARMPPITRDNEAEHRQSKRRRHETNADRNGPGGRWWH